MKKKKSDFLSENFQFLVVKFSIYLNRRVFVMKAGSATSPITSRSITHTIYTPQPLYNTIVRVHSINRVS